jgi:hypothetical protein
MRKTPASIIARTSGIGILRSVSIWSRVLRISGSIDCTAAKTSSAVMGFESVSVAMGLVPPRALSRKRSDYRKLRGGVANPLARRLQSSAPGVNSPRSTALRARSRLTDG